MFERASAGRQKAKQPSPTAKAVMPLPVISAPNTSLKPLHISNVMTKHTPITIGVILRAITIVLLASPLAGCFVAKFQEAEAIRPLLGKQEWPIGSGLYRVSSFKDGQELQGKYSLLQRGNEHYYYGDMGVLRFYKFNGDYYLVEFIDSGATPIKIGDVAQYHLAKVTNGNVELYIMFCSDLTDQQILALKIVKTEMVCTVPDGLSLRQALAATIKGGQPSRIYRLVATLPDVAE